MNHTRGRRPGVPFSSPCSQLPFCLQAPLVPAWGLISVRCSQMQKTPGQQREHLKSGFWADFCRGEIYLTFFFKHIKSFLVITKFKLSLTSSLILSWSKNTIYYFHPWRSLESCKWSGFWKIFCVCLQRMWILSQLSTLCRLGQIC